MKEAKYTEYLTKNRNERVDMELLGGQASQIRE